jgi:hypothetical protein
MPWPLLALVSTGSAKVQAIHLLLLLPLFVVGCKQM